jgi:hypothetical protein
MRRVVHGRVSGAHVEPFEPVELPEGTDVEVHWQERPRLNPGEGLRRSFGGWRHKVDCEALRKRLFG